MRKNSWVIIFIFLLFVGFIAPPVWGQDSETSRVIEKMKESISKIGDMRCLFIKDEVKQGRKIPQMSMTFKYKREPETIFVKFLDVHKGQKCLFVRGQNDNTMIVRPEGFLKFITIRLDPLSERAMKECLNPITMIGFETIIGTAEEWYAKSVNDPSTSMTITEDVSEDGRPMYRLFVPPGENGDFLVILVDKVTFLPCRLSYASGNDGATYIYENVEINCGLGSEDFEI